MSRAEAGRLLALKDRRETKARAILDELFDKQKVVARSWLNGQRFMSLCCSRRAGKTQLLARMIAIALVHAGPSEWVVFGARTLQIARDIIWSELFRINQRHELGWKLNEQHGTITTPAGGCFRLVGVVDKKSVEKVRGKRYRLVVLDEAATYQELLQRLYNDAFRPGLVDLGGALVLSGTPGYVCAGYWFEAATGKLHYEVHYWTLRDNPHMRDPDAELASVLRENKWTEEEPSYKREYLGLWVNDESTLVYSGYLATRNKQAPHAALSDGEWLCTLGCDYGVNDATALVVLGTQKGDDRTYVLHASKYSGLLPDEVADLMAQLVDMYKPTSAVGDSGGLGKPYVLEWNRRHAERANLHLKPAEKTAKLAAIELVNGAFRSSKLMLTPGTEEIEEEIQYLPWFDSLRTKEHPQYPNHSSDALLYAFREHSGYAFVTRPEAPPEPYRKWSTVEERKARNRKKQTQDWWDA